MRDFYTDYGIDIFKDAVSLPGVSMKFVLRGTLTGPNAPELYAPNKEAYDMLKASVTGGPSIVFTRYHEAGVSRIRSHQVAEARPCQRILGYDANALYLSTMAAPMPCGEGHCRRPDDVEGFVAALREGRWFGFAEVDIEVPEYLWPKFEEMPPLFYSKEIPVEAVPQEMLDCLERTGRTRSTDAKLVGALWAKKILLYAPLLRWYLDHGLVITAVYRTIDCQPQKIFGWFVDQVTEARRQGDTDKDKALFADLFKLLRNSCYGKFIEALERQTLVSYTTDEAVVDRALRSSWFEDLNEIGEATELHRRKQKIEINRPFQKGITVYQLAKLRILEFYYDFLDRFVDRKDFELIQMDTDSLYMAISGTSLDEIVRLELRGEFEGCKKQWLAWNKWSGRTPGLFKLEFEGTRAIALCSKAYYVDSEGKSKTSAKGMAKKDNDLTWGRYKATLDGALDRAEN